MNPSFVDLFVKLCKLNKHGIEKKDEQETKELVYNWTLLNQRHLTEQINNVKYYLVRYIVGLHTVKNKNEGQYDDKNIDHGGNNNNNDNGMNVDYVTQYGLHNSDYSESNRLPKNNYFSDILLKIEDSNNNNTSKQNHDTEIVPRKSRIILNTNNNTAFSDYSTFITKSFISALDHLCDVFGLTGFERNILILCVGFELDSSFGFLCSKINGGNVHKDGIYENDNNDNNNTDSYDQDNNTSNKINNTLIDNNAFTNSSPNFSMALSAFPDSHWSAVSPKSSVRKYGLVEIDDENFSHLPVVLRPIKISERILHYLTGVFFVDQKLENISNSVFFQDDSSFLKSNSRNSDDYMDHYINSNSYNKIISNIVDVFNDSSAIDASSTRFVFKDQNKFDNRYYKYHRLGKKKLFPIVQLLGNDEVSKLQICFTVLSKIGRRLVVIPAISIPGRPEDQNDLIKVLYRESHLMNLGYYIYFTEDMNDEAKSSVARFLDNTNNFINVPIILGSKEENKHLKFIHAQHVHFNVNKPTRNEQASLWIDLISQKKKEFEDKKIELEQQQQQQEQKRQRQKRHIHTGKIRNHQKEKEKNDGSAIEIRCNYQDNNCYHNDDKHISISNLVKEIVEYYDLNISDIKLAVDQSFYKLEEFNLPDKKNDVLSDPYETIQNLEYVLYDSINSIVHNKFPGLVEKISSSNTLDDLIISQREKELLSNIVVHVKKKSTVYDDWGFNSKYMRGSNTIALFHGISGTGKTMAAESIANTLKLGLYRIDLSSIVSKYIGETEKNLDKVFTAAENGGCVLFFDEADALFGKRTTIKDSHDRYANIEINYLLQKLESSSKIVLTILATNMKDSLDEAFLRRIKFIVNFPFPEYGSRVKMWESIFPKKTPLGDLNFPLLGKLSLTGGQIRNIAENAAFMAAHKDTSVTMEHIKLATQQEFLKTGKIITNDIWRECKKI